MTCIEDELFGDLLIGNYMRTTLYNVEALYPNFTPFVAKYGDNGGAKTKRELARYFGHYYMRDPIAHTLKSLADASEMAFAQGDPGRLGDVPRREAHLSRLRGPPCLSSVPRVGIC